MNFFVSKSKLFHRHRIDPLTSMAPNVATVLCLPIRCLNMHCPVLHLLKTPPPTSVYPSLVQFCVKHIFQFFNFQQGDGVHRHETLLKLRPRANSSDQPDLTLLNHMSWIKYSTAHYTGNILPTSETNDSNKFCTRHSN